MAEVRLERVAKVYKGAIQAVCDLNLNIADGERIAIVGPSGCGKTTTLRMIAGLESVTSGQIYFNSRPIGHSSPADRHVTMVFQSPTLYPHLSVRQNLLFGLRRRAVPTSEIEARINEAVNLLELESLLERCPDELSGGQQQRVAIGRAIVRRPQVFLLDEPLSDLDPTWRARLRREIINLHRHLQTTMIYVTHDQAEAMTVGQRIVVLRSGVVQQIDAPQQVFHRPANRFVAGFLGSPPMNFLSAEVSDQRVFWQGNRLPVTAPISEGPVTVGVRPEDISLHPKTSEAEAWLGRICMVDFLGHETILHVDVAGQPLVIRSTSGMTAQAGQWMRLEFRPNQLHLFAADSGEARLN